MTRESILGVAGLIVLAALVALGKLEPEALVTYMVGLGLPSPRRVET